MKCPQKRTEQCSVPTKNANLIPPATGQAGSHYEKPLPGEPRWHYQLEYLVRRQASVIPV